ncbi:MAG: hypothetical protein AB7T49_06450 [Oligoflexales bacterium]
MIDSKTKLWAEDGFSLIEVTIALGVLLTLLVGGTMKLREIRGKMDSVRLWQTADVLANRIADLSKSQKGFDYSAAKSSNKVVKDCWRNMGADCTSKSIALDFDLYMLNSPDPYTGNEVYYNMDGNSCVPPKPNCILQVHTHAQFFCLPGSTCPKASQPVVLIEVYNAKTKKLLRKVSSDVQMDYREQIVNLSLTCPTGRIMKGIGLDGKAICDPVSGVTYADAATFPPLDIKPTSCTGDPAVVNDLKFVSGIDKDGNLICTAKFW